MKSTRRLALIDIPTTLEVFGEEETLLSEEGKEIFKQMSAGWEYVTRQEKGKRGD